ncbi:conserved hypothetical protein [Candidatus Sulfopaludibacter sp. SbA6]|nr:conserved hypothetical protein [Candidatus Sulfopaludibacter sp. SbA6]
MSTKTLLSLEQFTQLPDDDTRHELDEGELIEMPCPKFRHSRVGKRFYDAIMVYLLDRSSQGTPLGDVFSETAYHLKHSGGEDTVRVPDVSYMDYNRAAKADPDSYIQGAPALAVEVVSPSDTAQQLARKVAQYLAAGAALVWVAYPESREVHVFYPRPGNPSEREARILTESETLTAPDLLPGWEGIPLRQLFE